MVFTFVKGMEDIQLYINTKTILFHGS